MTPTEASEEVAGSHATVQGKVREDSVITRAPVVAWKYPVMRVGVPRTAKQGGRPENEFGTFLRGPQQSFERV